MGGAAAVVVATAGMGVGQLSAHATTTSFSVDSNLDAAPGTCVTLGHGTLRDCINAADATPGTNTITFSVAVVAPIILTMGELPITGAQALTITGSGQAATIIDGNAASRVFNVAAAATTTLSDLTVRNGRFTNPSGFDGGGGIRDAGVLTLTRVTVSGNQSLAAAGVSATSGGLFDAGTGLLTIQDSTFSGNTVTSDHDAAGGAVQDCCSGTEHVVITGSTFTGNTATTTTGQAFGGVLASHGIMSISGSTFSGNTDSQTSSVSGSGAGASVIVSHGTLTIDRSTFHANTTTGAAANIGGTGAVEICCGGAPTLTVTGSTFDHNTVTGDGSSAAAIDVCCGAGGSIATSTFDSNSVSGTGSGGGAAYIATTAGKGSFPITDSTFTGNSASGTGATGGALIVDLNSSPAPAVAFTNDTIDGNSAPSGANLFVARDAAMSMLNTIVSGSPAANCTIQAGTTITDLGHNLDDASTSTCGFSAANADVLGSDPKLDGLAANGGSTRTQALLTGSPAIDAGSSSGCPSLDQRGTTRVTSGDPTCDIGAFEVVQTKLIPVPTAGAGLRLPLALLLLAWGTLALGAARRRRTTG